MAAVLVLIMMPLIAALALFAVVTHADGSFASALAMATVFALGTGVLVGVMRFVHTAEES
jgi:hypothetical protein